MINNHDFLVRVLLNFFFYEHKIYYTNEFFVNYLLKPHTRLTKLRANQFFYLITLKLLKMQNKTFYLIIKYIKSFTYFFFFIHIYYDICFYLKYLSLSVLLNVYYYMYFKLFMFSLLLFYLWLILFKCNTRIRSLAMRRANAVLRRPLAPRPQTAAASANPRAITVVAETNHRRSGATGREGATETTEGTHSETKEGKNKLFLLKRRYLVFNHYLRGTPSCPVSY